MNKVEIEKIALEVAKEKLHMLLDSKFGSPEYFSVSSSWPQMVEFATGFLARIDAERGKAAVAWVDTLDAARPRCVTSLDYRSLIEAELGVEYVPLFRSPTIPEGVCPVPIEPTGKMIAAAVRAFPCSQAETFRAMIAAAQGENK